MMVLEQGRISIKQLIALFFLSRIIEALTFFPVMGAGAFGPAAGRDTWLAIMIATFISLVVLNLWVFLGEKHQGQTVIEYMQTLLGKPLGKLMGIILVWFFLHQTSLVLRDIGEVFISTVMPETPLLVFLVITSLIGAIVVHDGLEATGRLAELLIFGVLLSIILTAFLIYPEIETRHFSPFLEKGMTPVIYSAFYVVSRQTEILILAMALPYISDKRQVGRWAGFAIILSNLFILLSAVIVIGVFTAEQADRHVVFEYFSVLRLISIGDFLERIDSLALAIWLAAGVVRAAIFGYCAVLGLAQVCSLQQFRALTLPFYGIAIPLALLLFENTRERAEYIGGADGPYSLVFLVVLPVLLLIVWGIRSALALVSED